MVTLAICVVVAVLTPVIISRYGVSGHELWLVCSLVALVIFLGLFPDQEPALYLTAVGLILFLDALNLLFLVFSQRRPQSASDPAHLPATGGSRA